MKGLQGLIDSIEYIENNLDGKLQIDHIAKMAHMSKFHFQRMFHMLTGFTVSEYIRNRRITVAAQEFIQTNGKVIDIAAKYGYESPESFAKAFRKIHGISPSEAKKGVRTLKAYPKLTFQLQIKGDVEMNYKIVEKEGFTVVGKSIRTKTTGGEHHEKITEFWNESNSNGFSKKLAEQCGPLGLLGICFDIDHEQEYLTYLIGAEKI